MLYLVAAFSLSVFMGCPAPQEQAKSHPNLRAQVQGVSFPTSSALAEGVSPEVLAKLDRLIKGLVQDDEIVGAELLVIKNGKSILHEAYGWNDRESQKPMQTGSVFCVRSMTKPFIAAAVLMLVDANEIELDDPIVKYLPYFDVEELREITIEQLLTHTSGMPMSQIMLADLLAIDGIQGVAKLGAEVKLGFRPGSDLSYSDQGTDTLTALLEVVSGLSAAEFVETRLLQPLGMQDSACVMGLANPLRARGCSKYAGSTRAWTRFWHTEQAPLFPFFLGSQALYSTLKDYARFMDFWQRKGRAGKEKLLGSRFVRKALTPSPYALGSRTGFPGARADYGYLMQLWTQPGEESKRELIAFGHTGSDGTHAWTFPKQKAMVLYFTQSRNNVTGMQVEEVLAELFLGATYDPIQEAPPLEEYLGYYKDSENDLYRAIIQDGKGLALEVSGRGVVPLVYVGDDGWKLRPNPSVVLRFERSQAGEVIAYSSNGHREYRFEPSDDLPSVAELAERVASAHRLDLLQSLGPLRMECDLSMEKIGLEGVLTKTLAGTDRYRVDTQAAGNFEKAAVDGADTWYSSNTKPLAQLEGQQALQLKWDSPFVRYGNWKSAYPAALVLQRLDNNGQEIILLRTGDTSSAAANLYIDWESGRVMRESRFMLLDGMGRVGQRITYGDFQDIDGILLPFRTEVEYANSMLGTAVISVREFELGLELPEGSFSLQPR